MSNGWKKFQMRSYGREQNKYLLNNKLRKENGVGFAHALWKPQGTLERDTMDWNPQGTRRRGRPRTTWKKHNRMGNAEGWKKLERDKRTSLR
jgi:hypothetical protein